MQNEIVTAMSFECRGVKHPTNDQAKAVDTKVYALQPKARSNTIQELNCTHVINLPVLSGSESVPAIVTVSRDGTREVLCPCNEHGRCSAIARADMQGADDIRSQFDPESNFDLPLCPYDSVQE